jgi:hypothetical protein
MEASLAQLQADILVIYLMLATVLVFIMHAGFAMLETGLTRAKSAANIIFKNLGTIAVGVLIYYAIGWGLMYGSQVAGLFGVDQFFLLRTVEDRRGVQQQKLLVLRADGPEREHVGRTVGRPVPGGVGHLHRDRIELPEVRRAAELPPTRPDAVEHAQRFFHASADAEVVHRHPLDHALRIDNVRRSQAHGFIRAQHAQVARQLLRRQQRIRQALDAAIQFIHEHPAETYALMAQHSRPDAPLTEAGWQEYTFALRLDQSLLPMLENVARWAIRYRLTEATGVRSPCHWLSG